MSEFVSILIPCYNADRWIKDAIESALAQTWAAKEVIVVDDGSTDRSSEIIRSFGDQIRSEVGSHRGGNGARNRLLELARGAWAQYLDADDYLLPEKIALQMEFLSAHPDCDVLFGPVTEEHWSGHDVRRELVPIPEPHDIWILLASWLLPQTNAPLWRKQAIRDVGGWKLDQPCCQEHELYLRLLLGGKRFQYCPTNGAVYRRWSNKTLSTHDTQRVLAHRIEIEQRAEDYLRERGQLTLHRLRAINQARFQIARIKWQIDPSTAKRIMGQVRMLEPDFIPSGAAAPAHYRFAFRCLGFPAAEYLATAARSLLHKRRYIQLVTAGW